MVRAEFLRTRNYDYIRAARAMGVPDRVGSCPATCCPTPWWRRWTFPLFILRSITTLTSLDFSASVCRSVRRRSANCRCKAKTPAGVVRLGITAFLVLAVLLSLLIFIGEAVRDAF